MNCQTVCFIGHRKIKDTPELRTQVKSVLTELIEQGTVNFIFGDNSAFNDLCYEIVTEFKGYYPKIRRIKYRKDYEHADDYTMKFLIDGYEENFCPKDVGKSGKASYVKRNQAMIRASDVCIFYYDKSYMPARRKNKAADLSDYQPKSGTNLAYQYAVKSNKRIYNLKEMQ